MKKRSIADQRRIIRIPDIPEETRVPTMPLLVVLENGVVGEATTVRGIVSIIIGNEYLDIEDRTTEWHVRVETARREVMKALSRDINAVVYDKRVGVVENNYAAAPEDPDYDDDPDELAPFKVRVENDRLFILSLLQLGGMKVLERTDSYMLRPHKKWEEEKLSNGALQCCGRCLHAEDNENKIICPVYNLLNEKTDGSRCGSYTPKMTSDAKKLEYTGGEYIDLAQEYDIDDLMSSVGQEWFLEHDLK